MTLVINKSGYALDLSDGRSLPDGETTDVNTSQIHEARLLLAGLLQLAGAPTPPAPATRTVLLRADLTGEQSGETVVFDAQGKLVNGPAVPLSVLTAKADLVAGVLKSTQVPPIDLAHLAFDPGTQSELDAAQASLAAQIAARPPGTILPWAANTAYKRGQAVTQSGGFYSALGDFTSGAAFNAANWLLIGSQAAPLVDEISRFAPFTAGAQALSLLGLGNFSGSSLLYNSASFFAAAVRFGRLPAHWATAEVAVFWAIAVAGVTGGPTLRLDQGQFIAEGGDSASTAFVAGASVVVPSVVRTQYQIVKTVLCANLVVDPSKVTALKVLRVSNSSNLDGLAADIGLLQVRMRRTS